MKINFRQKKQRKAQSLVEIASLLVFVMVAMLVFQKYIARGFYGRWKGVGDSLGYQRIYDPNSTVECGFDRWTDSGLWYNAVCFDSTCGEHDCVAATATPANCRICIETTCQSSYGAAGDICNRP